ncbi:hypothetical protein [Streptomyces sp. NPDC059491]|uniref:hypothetical protein n=1 Tax=Streptomyces sp. NPDC059491 TaxID=3346850 RepID=UPI00367DBBFD
MRQRVEVHEVRLDGGGVRVVRSAPAPGRLALHDDGHWLSMDADRAGVGRLTALWALAARSPRSLVHLPIRAEAASGGVAGEGPPALDLVLAHHSLQFPAAAWKGVRSRLGTGRPQTVRVPDGDFPDEDDVDHDRWYHGSFRDHLRFDIAARTLFVVGSATAFREHGAVLRRLVDEAPSRGQGDRPSRHHCVELTSGPRTRPRARGRVPTTLHVEYRGDRGD